MFQSSRSRLLLYYLLVMAAILCIFSAAFFGLFSRSLYRQIDEGLETLVRVAVPSFTQVSQNNHYLDDLEEAPWRDIFNSEQQSLEWFDTQGRLLAHQGKLKLFFPPKIGFWTLVSQPKILPYQIRTFTLSISLEQANPSQPPLEGYIRGSQTTEELQQVQNQFLWQLGISILFVLGVIGLSGLWLTQKALEPVMRSFKQLQQFTADASHELRGPLTAIQASVDVMRNHPERFENKDAKKLAAIASATEQMTHLTQDLLFLARTEAKENINQEQWQCLALEELLDDLYDWLEPVADAKSIEFKYHCQGKAKIRGDQAQLSRLFSNLVENALNYTPEGGKITLRLVSNNQSAIVSVKDTGIGIPSESLPFVFDRFWRADQARTYRQGGTGLGLAIAQAIAYRHGGQITVTSQMGQGSCFQVVLPLYRPEANSMPEWSAVPRLQLLSWKSLKRQFYLERRQSIRLLKKTSLFSMIVLLSILPLVILTLALTQVQTFQGLKFPQGGISFADEVVYYKRDTHSAPFELTSSQGHDNPLEALGIPNAQSGHRFFFFGQPPKAVQLGPGGILSLKFTDNLLSGNGNSDSDLWVFSSQPLTSPLAVSISQDGTVWHGVGYVDAQQSGVDLDRWGWGNRDFFSYVRLINDFSPESLTPKIQPVAIDAVGAISSIKIIPSQTGWLPQLSPLTRSVLFLLLLFSGIFGVRYGWKLNTLTK